MLGLTVRCALSDMLKIAHIIGGLGVGGAEKMLQRLVTEHRKQPDVAILVVSMTSLGATGEALKSEGVDVRALNMTGLFSAITGFVKLIAMLRHFRPDGVQTWLYWADLVGGVAARLCDVKALAWNIRCTHFGDGRWTGHLVKLNARLSRWLPHSIICCGHTPMHFHSDQGFDASKMVVLPNGYDLDYFRPDANGRAQPDPADRITVVAIGRMDVLKDYPTLVAAAKIAVDADPSLHFAIYGRGCPQHVPTQTQISALGIGRNFQLHEEVRDTRVPLADADIFVSSSVSEGFPNVVAEAMAMQVPCVVTDAGDAALIVGDTGAVAPVSDPPALAARILDVARQSPTQRKAMGRAARLRVEQHYEIGHVANLYLDHYRNILHEPAHAV